MNQYSTALDNTQLAANDYISGANYKITRALWYAYYRPEDGRHGALEADDLPDVYRRVYAAIRADGRLAYLSLADDLEALDLFATLQTIPKPRLLDTPRRTDALPDDLAAELWARIPRAIDAAGAGTGDWPAEPMHTCAAKEETGTALVLRPDELSAARMFNPTWHTCPACYHKRVKRIGQQVQKTIAAAGPLSWRMLDADEYKRWAATVRQHRKRMTEGILKDYGDQWVGDLLADGLTIADATRTAKERAQEQAAQAVQFRAHPQDDGRYFVMSTHGLAGDEVPTEKRDLYDLLAQYVRTPEGRRASASHGFGGDYRRLKGDGRGAGIRLWTDARLEHVAAAVGSKVKTGSNALRVKIDQLEAFTRLTAAGIALRARKGEAPALTQLTDAVTNKGYSDQIQDYPLSVTDEAEAGALPDKAPPLLPAHSVTDDAQEVRQWPIYLV